MWKYLILEGLITKECISGFHITFLALFKLSHKRWVNNAISLMKRIVNVFIRLIHGPYILPLLCVRDCLRRLLIPAYVQHSMFYACNTGCKCKVMYLCIRWLELTPDMVQPVSLTSGVNLRPRLFQNKIPLFYTITIVEPLIIRKVSFVILCHFAQFSWLTPNFLTELLHKDNRT